MNIKLKLMSFIDELKKERGELKKRIDAIDVLLDSYGVVSINNSSHSNEKANVGFPRSGRTDKQILWLFENHFTRGIRMSDVNIGYNHFNGTVNENVDNITRRLRKEGNLVTVKYNGQNKLSFYGLPTWVEDNDFKEIYKPSEDDLPLGDITSEVIKN